MRGLDCPLSNQRTLAGVVKWNIGAAAWLPRGVPSATHRLPTLSYSIQIVAKTIENSEDTEATSVRSMDRWTDHGGGVGSDNGVLVRLKAEGHLSVGRDAHESGGN